MQDGGVLHCDSVARQIMEEQFFFSEENLGCSIVAINLIHIVTAQ